MANHLNLMITFSSSRGWLYGVIRRFFKSRITPAVISIDTSSAQIAIGADKGVSK